jgi:NADPH2:quinone reductase
MRESLPLSFPHVPGMDGAGVVLALGPDVQGLAVGDEVFGFFGRTPGTVAEYALIDAGHYLAAIPGGLDPVHAAALPESGITAKTLLRAVAGALAPGRALLVVGATGGIGTLLVQLASALGCEVLATAAPADRDYVLALGAAHALDYTAGDTAEQARALRPDGVDAVVDLVNSGDGVVQSAKALRDGGVFASPLGGPAEVGRGISPAYVSLTLLPGDLDDLAARAALGSLRVEVSRVYPLRDAAQAFSDFAGAHTRGKLVVQLDFDR